MICPECNSEINENVKFCEYCGYKLPNQPQQQLQYQQPQQYQQPPQYQQPQNNVLKVQIVHERENPRIRELEKKIEEYKNSGIFFIFCFYPVAIYLFIRRAQFKKELSYLRQGINPKLDVPNYNLGWKTFGMWWVFAILGELIWLSINYLIGDPMTSANANDMNLIMLIGMVFMVILPSFLAYLWYKKHKVQVQ